MEILWTGITITPKRDITSGAVSPVEVKDLGWRPGQILQGVVLMQLMDDIYLVRLDGKDVVAQSPYTLVEDQTVAMEVQGQKDGQYMVRLLRSGAAEEGGVIKSLIGQLGVEDTPLNRVLIQGFLAKELPLKPELLQQAARILQILGKNTPEDVEPVLLALKWGVPLKPRLLEVIHAFMTGLKEAERGSESQLAHLARQLSGLWEGIPEGSRPRGDGGIPVRPESVPSLPLSKEGTVLFQRVKDLLQAMVLKPEEGKEKVVEQLRSLLASQLPKSGQNSGEVRADVIVEGAKGSFVEMLPDQAKAVSAKDGEFFREASQDHGSASGALARGPGNLKSFTGVPTDKPATVSPPVNGVLTQAIPENLPAPETMVRVTGNLENATVFEMLKDGQHSGEPPGRPEDGQNPGTAVAGKEVTPEVQGKRLRAFSDLLETFSRLIQEVREAMKEAGHLPKGQPIVREGSMIESQMAGHQIFQSLESESHQQDYLYFNLPFIKNGETETWGQLRIMKDAGGKKTIDPRRFSSAILLHTVNLGPLLLEIKVWNKDVTANGKVTEDWVAQMLKKAWPKLQEAFEAMGYRLQQCQWKVGPFEENLQPRESKPQKVERGLRFLDTTV